VQWAVDHEPALRFEPGSAWEYSNTNFVLLGLVIEAVTGHTYEAELQTRLLEPLALSSTYLAVSGDANPAIVDSYSEQGVNLTGSADPSFGWSAGALVSTPEDLARWGVALYGGGVLSADSLEQMLTPVSLSDGTAVENYGLGAFVEVDGSAAIYGHTGGIEGYQTYLFYWAPDRIALVAMANRLEVNLRDLAGYGWSVPLNLPFP
jgi:D-alanyl-D-alanine carboxypeptidase